MTRKKNPEKTEASVLAANRHLCCICHKEGRAVQIHHIDGDHTNNDISNLAVLCTQHYEEVSRKSLQGKGYSSREVTIYKELWEEHCKLERNKGTVVNNYLILSEQVPSLKNPEIMRKFMTGVSGSTTWDSVNSSTGATAHIVVGISDGRLSVDDFLGYIFKNVD